MMLLRMMARQASTWQRQSYRGANDIDALISRIKEEVIAGRLDQPSTDAALAACGMQRPPSQAMALHLTDRERKVLVHLARGLTNKG
jgi:DNA-binding NarL/FixJ family response regulator